MIDRNQKKSLARKRRQRRVRAKVKGTAARPRLSVFRSAKHISAQIIDDEAGKTLAAATDEKLGKKAEGAEGMKAKVAAAYAVGKAVAEAAKKAGIEAVVFDRNGFAYSGRVAALAEGARQNGLKF
jgi:large subunit ribosomal protein L18